MLERFLRYARRLYDVNRISLQSTVSRILYATTPKAASEGEERIKEVLKKRFPFAATLEVTDISGGCGAMYDICVESSEFESLNRVKQHQLVTEALKEEIKDMHGLRIHTTIPENCDPSTS